MKLSSALIVDDNETDVYILKRLIKGADLTDKVFVAENGKEALEFMSNYEENCKQHPGMFPPLLVFLDINMPLMNGFEFLEEFSKVRQQYDYDSCVLMMFTSSESEEDRDTALGYDFVNGYITKMPDSSGELKRQVAVSIPGIE